MASLRELRIKIKSVKSTQQITKAMKMVAAARLRRAQARILAARPFAVRMEDLLSDILFQLADVNKDNVLSEEELTHPLLKKRTEGVRGVLLLTSDKGLCGSFNTNLIKKALEFLRENGGQSIALFCVGRKGRDFFRRMGLSMRGEYVGIFNQLSFAHAELIGRDVAEFFLKENVRDVTLIYNEFKSVIQQILVRKTLLPLRPPRLVNVAGERPVQAADFIYEPGKDQLLEALFPRYLKAQIFRALLDSYASEMGARMTAMESANKNAKELIDGLTLTANKIRQAAITKEISELVSGAEALQ
jgi:F-type H+-transporting ATPase subunit gamma